MGWTQADLDNLQARKREAIAANREALAKGPTKPRKGPREPQSSDDALFVKTCIAAGLPEPVAEYKFHETRKWRIDYYFERGPFKVGLEVEGGAWIKGGGRHNRGKGFLGDMEKYNSANIQGIAILRTTPDALFSQGLADVAAWFKNNEGCSPSK